ncbi:MAG: hypothetical protein AAF629_02975 [Chloroflexota bacterium]
MISFISGCDTSAIIQITPLDSTATVPVLVASVSTATPLPTPIPQVTPTDTAIPLTPTPVPVPTVSRPTSSGGFITTFNTSYGQRLSGRLERARQEAAINQQDYYPRHGLVIAFIIPLIFFGIPWAFLEIAIARYVQPKGIDLTGVRVKAQDGLFIQAIVSMTARKTLSLVSVTIRWPLVKDVVEKAVEQELIHEALNYDSLPLLENNLRDIAERLTELPVIDELSRDFGVEVLRFNIEIRYPSETADAINRTAEASAGGQAFIAYAKAAHLDPDSPEARQLYEVFQQTSSQVDAARNLGGGITDLASLFSAQRKAMREGDLDDEPET